MDTRWFFWQNNTKAGDEPPGDWVALGNALLEIMERKYVEKVELAAFVIRGSRRARWLLDRSDPEYSTEREAMNVAKKLSALILLSRDPSVFEYDLFPLIKCRNTVSCRLYEGLEGVRRTTITNYLHTRCLLCGVKINLEDFDSDGRRDNNSITMAHRSPLARMQRGHNAKAVSWVHRSCNGLLSSLSLDEAIDKIREILEYQGYSVRRRA